MAPILEFVGVKCNEASEHLFLYEATAHYEWEGPFVVIVAGVRYGIGGGQGASRRHAGWESAGLISKSAIGSKSIPRNETLRSRMHVPIRVIRASGI